MLKRKYKRFDEKIERERRARKLIASEMAALKDDGIVVRQVFSAPKQPPKFRLYGENY